MTYIVSILDHEIMQDHAGTFVSMDRETIGEPWSEVNFLLDLPRKWEYSRVVFDATQKPVGFAVASAKGVNVHIHRIVIDKDLRGHGLGTKLLRAVTLAAKQQNLQGITLKVARENADAVRFYRGLGFAEIGRDTKNLTLGMGLSALLQKTAFNNISRSE